MRVSRRTARFNQIRRLPWTTGEAAVPEGGGGGSLTFPVVLAGMEVTQCQLRQGGPAPRGRETPRPPRAAPASPRRPSDGWGLRGAAPGRRGAEHPPHA